MTLLPPCRRTQLETKDEWRKDKDWEVRLRLRCVGVFHPHTPRPAFAQGSFGTAQPGGDVSRPGLPQCDAVGQQACGSRLLPRRFARLYMRGRKGAPAVLARAADRRQGA